MTERDLYFICKQETGDYPVDINNLNLDFEVTEENVTQLEILKDDLEFLKKYIEWLEERYIKTQDRLDFIDKHIL